MTKKQKTAQQEALTRLRDLIHPGDVVYTTLRHVSRSGMMRSIDCHVIRDNQPHWIGGLVATALGCPFNDHQQGVRVGGCGMDMGFHLVYELSYRLFKDGFHCLGMDSCPANDHFNEHRDPAGYNPSRLHSDPGYALKQRWL